MGGGKGSNKTTSSFKLPPEFIKAYNESLGLARQAIQTPYQPYTGQLVAGLTPGQQQGISNIQAAQGMALPAIQRGMGYTEEAARGITPELYNRFYSPYVRDVADATFANLMESNAQQRSGLKSGAIQAGAFGGDRGGIAQAEMARQQNLGLGQTMSGIYNQGYGQAMGLAGQQVANLGQMGQQMAGLGTAAQGSALQGAQAQMAAGAQEQATAQAQLQAAYDQFLRQQSYPFQIAQYFANIAQGLGSTAGGTSTTTAPPPNAASQIIGGIGALGSLASGIGSMSDERVKENIEAVGKLNDGQTVYRYNFKGDPKTQIGLLAQEVEHHKPGAVTEAHGLKMVDYKGATDDAASSMGGVVTPDMQRAAFADGGVPFMPYLGGSGFVPEGKLGGGGGNAIPKEHQKIPDTSLSDDWQQIKPFTEDQKAGLEALSGKVRAMFGKPEASALGMISQVPTNAGLAGGNIDPARYLKPMVDAVNAPTFEATPIPLNENLSYAFARGGVAGRSKYEYGGSPMDEAMAEAEAMREAERLGGAEYPRLIQKESGGDYGARNAQGYVGRGQFGDARLEDARRAGVLPEGMDKEAFRNNPQAQQNVEKWHFSDINDFIDKRGLGAFEGKTIGGVPVTREGLVNVAHLGGKGGLEKFITSGGRYNPADANGTRLSDYLSMGAQSGGVGAAPAPSGYSDTQIMPVSSEVAPEGVAAAEKDRTPFSIKNLFASEDRPSIIESIIGRRLSPEARNAVLNASFALMAGRSPFFATNLGEAGKVGTQTYYNALQMKRELAKQQADIARQGFEAQTGRMGVEIQDINARRQLAGLVMPLVQTLVAYGQPVPPQYMRMIEDVYPPGSPERQSLGNVNAPSSVSAEAPVPSSETNLPPSPVTAEGAPKETAETVKSSGGNEPAPPATGVDLKAIYAGVDPSENPYEWDKKAEQARAAGRSDLVQAAVDKAQYFRQRDFDRGYIISNGNRVPYPFKQEQIATEEATKLNVKNVIDFDNGMSELQSSLPTRTMISEGLRDSLSRAETGKFASTKADLISALNSFGLATPEQLSQAADIQTAMKYFAQSILDSGMKDKIGPQISNADLQLVSTGTGSVENIAAANRRIVGAVYGKIMYDSLKADEWNKFVEKNGGQVERIKPIDFRKWQQQFEKEHSLVSFVKKAVADTPVKGEISLDTPQDYFRVGYKYVMPDGKIKTYTGKEEDNFFVGEE